MSLAPDLGNSHHRSRLSPAARSLLWGVFGLAIALFLQWDQVTVTGRINGLLFIGEDAPIRTAVENDFDDLAVAPGIGHDGQAAYAVAVDPLGHRLPQYLDSPGYRYRRVLLPSLGGLFGFLNGDAVAIGLAGVSAVALALGTGATSLLAEQWGAAKWAPLAVAFNPGMWMSVRLLTPDALALGVGIAGLTMWTRGRLTPAGLLFGASALAKDQYLVLGLATAAWVFWQGNRKDAVRLALWTTVPVAIWTAIVEAIIGGGFNTGGQFGPPLAGLIDSVGIWQATPTRERLLTLVVVVGLLATLVVFWRGKRMITLLLVPWVVMAVLAKHDVWDLGTNSSRAFAPIFTLVGISLAVRLRTRTEPEFPA